MGRMSSSFWSSTVLMKLREETVSRSRDGALGVVYVGGACFRTVRLPKEVTMADGSVHKGSAGRVLTRSLLERRGWEVEGWVSTHLRPLTPLPFLSCSFSFPCSSPFLFSCSSHVFHHEHVAGASV